MGRRTRWTRVLYLNRNRRLAGGSRLSGIYPIGSILTTPSVGHWDAPRRAEGHELIRRSEHERNDWHENVLTRKSTSAATDIGPKKP